MAQETRYAGRDMLGRRENNPVVSECVGEPGSNLLRFTLREVGT
jgi:hypothetical protein